MAASMRMKYSRMSGGNRICSAPVGSMFIISPFARSAGRSAVTDVTPRLQFSLAREILWAAWSLAYDLHHIAPGQVRRPDQPEYDIARGGIWTGRINDPPERLNDVVVSVAPERSR